jgi:small neutral amino acid transporter SnatA (MarC family)
MMGYEMLQAHLSRTQFDNETNHEYINDISITPWEFNYLRVRDHHFHSVDERSKSPIESGIVLGIIILLVAITYFLLLGAKQVTHLIGENGNKVMLVKWA